MPSRFDTESRIAVAQAADIARELGHREVGPDHLLAGLLANPRGTAYAALRDHGLDYEAVRDLVAEHHVDPEPRSDHREAGAYDDDRDALRAIGIDLDAVRAAVRANLGDDLAEGWADRRDRTRRGRRRRHDHHDHHELHEHDQEGRGRGRRGPRSRRPGPTFSASLRSVLREARRSRMRERAADHPADSRGGALTGSLLLLALTGSDDPATTAVLARTDTEALRARVEADLRAGATTGA